MRGSEAGAAPCEKWPDGGSGILSVLQISLCFRCFAKDRATFTVRNGYMVRRTATGASLWEGFFDS